MRSEERSFDEKTRCGFWMQELNAEWKVTCLCQQTKQRNPAFIEVYRKSLAGERMISGTLEIHEEKGQCLLKKKFICLLEDNCHSTTIDLNYPRNTTLPPPKIFLVTGEITIGANTEASFDLTELVHMTKTDYSSLKQLSDDMAMLLLEKSLLTDVSLKSGAVSIPAHKSILSARSSVFDTMFRCPMKETMENEVVIEDIEALIFQVVVKCIYTGKIEGIELYGPKILYLLYIANKYQITCVECICSKFLMRFMSSVDILLLPFLKDFVSPDLKNFIIDYMCNRITNFSDLDKQKIWIDWRNEHPALALEICSAFIKFQEKKLKRHI
ncbi:unnamed protein product [Larinioides sclopetarius]|uniref:BTB domain-containing protein n=1 Tax=Larinioides sclopetarius TaxID=280406 RepID=A0AAV2BWW7_9ARAC